MSTAEALQRIKQAGAVPLSQRRFQHAFKMVIERIEEELAVEPDSTWRDALQELTDAQKPAERGDRRPFERVVFRYYRRILVEQQLAGQEIEIPQTQEEWDRLREWRVA